MNFLSSKKLAFIFSIVITLLFATALSFSSAIPIPHLLLISCILFLAAFFIFWYLSEIFVYKKILSAIHSFRHLKNGKDRKSELTDATLKNIFSELEGWASDRKNEIEQLKKLELYRKEYIGNISHELKTPIFNIQGYVLTLLDGALEDKKVNRDYLVRTEKSVERMITMVEDLESISQLETGQLIVEREKFDIIALVKDVFDTQQMYATTKGIILSIKQFDDNPIIVEADKFRIRQVVTNLIVNSIKYGKEYGTTQVKFYDRENNIAVEISDNGIGIGSEHLPRLFERFYRVDKSRSREQGGTGLGLSIVKHIIEAHDQTISVSSKEGEGSVFTFALKKG